MAGLAAAAGQDALRGDHPVEVVGVGLATDQDHPLAVVGHLLGAVGVEDRLPYSSTRRGVHPLGDLLALGGVVEAREHQLS
jgi:hypothetical protein